MTNALARAFAVVVTLVTVATVGGEEPKDNYGDTLPPGAKARVGTARMVKMGDWSGAEWSAATLTPDGKFLLSSVKAGAIEKIDVSTGRVVGTIGEKVAARTGREFLYLSADGKVGATALSKSITAWDARTGRELNRIERKLPFGTNAVALSADGSTLSIGDEPERQPGMAPRKLSALVWTVGEAKRRVEVEVTPTESAFVALSRDGKLLVTWGLKWEARVKSDREFGTHPVQFWDATSGKALGQVTVEASRVNAVAFSPDGKVAAVGDEKGATLLIDPQTGRELAKLAGTPEGNRLVFSDDGKSLAIAGWDGTVQLWDIATNQVISTTKCPVWIWHSRVGMVFTGERQLAAHAAQDSRVIVWEVPSGKLLSPFSAHTKPPESLAFTPDGKELLSNGPRWTALRWDPATGKPLGTVKFEIPERTTSRTYHDVQLFPGGTLALTSVAESLYIHDPRTGKLVREFGTRGRDDTSLTSADGELMLAQRGWGLNKRSWVVTAKELATDKKLAELELPGGVMYCLPVTTPDRTKLVVPIYVPARGGTNADVVVGLYDLKTGKKLGEVTDAGDPKYLGVAPGPGNTAILTDAKYGLRILDFAAGKVAHRINTGGLMPSAGPVLSPDGKLFAVGLIDADLPTRPVHDIRLYDAATGKALKTFTGHRSRVTCLAFSPDGKTLATGFQDTTVLLWDVSDAK
jgi:WD40 repeat protein